MLSLEQAIVIEYTLSPISPRTWKALAPYPPTTSALEAQQYRQLKIAEIVARTKRDSNYALRVLSLLSPQNGQVFLTQDTNNIFKAEDDKINQLIKKRLLEGLTSPVEWIRTRALSLCKEEDQL